ncbi:hypothetical protein SAMN04488565_2053 [Leucobacter chromiiresistens]|uniref:DUF559 domain-containing protein n=2 Tax=Leucobacter chromiiresistens TaxID=1079994 RepID=A0A1H0ZTU4_9MICO|nr:hypothetical protein SAMN04488565_2053 [Leucobacter chromiiresistens]
MGMQRIDAVLEQYGCASFLASEALSAGISPGVLRNPRLARPFRGVRVAATHDDSLFGRAAAYVPRLRPGECFSHATALALFGCPIHMPESTNVDVESRAASGQVRCEGVTGHRRKRAERIRQLWLPEYRVRIPVVEPLQAALQASPTLPFPDLVVALDHLLVARRAGPDSRPLVSSEALERFCSNVRGAGSRRLRMAARYARTGAESRMETLTRLAGERVGVNDLTLQHTIYDDSGAWIGRFDLVDVQRKRIVEYDGDHHWRLRSQYLRDLERLDAARNAGWEVLVVVREHHWSRDPPLSKRLLTFLGRESRELPVEDARLLDERYARGLHIRSALPRARQDIHPRATGTGVAVQGGEAVAGERG